MGSKLGQDSYVEIFMTGQWHSALVQLCPNTSGICWVFPRTFVLRQFQVVDGIYTWKKGVRTTLPSSWGCHLHVTWHFLVIVVAFVIDCFAYKLGKAMSIC